MRKGHHRGSEEYYIYSAVIGKKTNSRREIVGKSVNKHKKQMGKEIKLDYLKCDKAKGG